MFQLSQLLFSKYTILGSSAAFLFITDFITDAASFEKLGIVGVLSFAIFYFARKDAQKQAFFEKELAEYKAGTDKLLKEKDESFVNRLKEKDEQIAKMEQRIYDLENKEKTTVSRSRKTKNQEQ